MTTTSSASHSLGDELHVQRHDGIAQRIDHLYHATTACSHPSDNRRRHTCCDASDSCDNTCRKILSLHVINAPTGSDCSPREDGGATASVSVKYRHQRPQRAAPLWHVETNVLGILVLSRRQ
jgi:hypothetical protein